MAAHVSSLLLNIAAICELIVLVRRYLPCLQEMKEEELIFQVLNKVTAVNLVAPAGASAAAGLF